MSTAPVTLDFSKSQPVAEGQPAASSGNVQLDFSRSKPIAGGGAPTTEAAAASGDYANQQAHNAGTEPIQEQHTAGDVPEASPVSKPGSGADAATLALGAEGGSAILKGTMNAGAAAAEAGGVTNIAKAGVKGASEVLGKLAAENPVAAKAAKAYGTYLAVHIAHKLGLPLPKILEVIGE